MAQKYRPLTSVLVKPSGPDCNLGCTYCFYLEKEKLFPETSSHRMSEETLEEMIRQVMQQSGREVSIGWQGGEPTLMGLPFFEKAVAFEKKYGYGKQVGNGFQTNGILLDQQWARFLKEYDFLVGLSLDGPQHIHDRYRLDKGEHPTWHVVEEKARMLLAEGVAVNAMCCLTDYSADYPDELYNYYKSLGLTWMQFIPVVEPDRNDPSRAASFSVSAEKYGNFLARIFDLWWDDFTRGEVVTSVRHIESVFFTYVGLESPECTMLRECGPYVVVEHNGNVYSCDFFVEPRHKLGNIRYEKLIDMLNSKKQDQFGKAKTALPRKCLFCHWQSKCFGGCTKDRVKDPADQRLPRFCESYIRFFEHADERLRAVAAKWKQNQADQSERESTGGVYNAFGDFLKK